jgi:hypothetical protein
MEKSVFKFFFLRKFKSSNKYCIIVYLLPPRLSIAIYIFFQWEGGGREEVMEEEKEKKMLEVCLFKQFQIASC